MPATCTRAVCCPLVETMHKTILSLMLATLLGCASSATSPQADGAAPSIDQAAAKALVVNAYRGLFRSAYSRNPTSGNCAQYPELRESDLNSVISRGEAWLVETGGTAGWTVTARVDKHGDWVEFLSVGFNPY